MKKPSAMCVKQAGSTMLLNIRIIAGVRSLAVWKPLVPSDRSVGSKGTGYSEEIQK